MISRLAIRNFRSLKDIELKPGRLTVLIGPNGSGKSNVIDALRFVEAFAWSGRSLTDEGVRPGKRCVATPRLELLSPGPERDQRPQADLERIPAR